MYLFLERPSQLPALVRCLWLTKQLPFSGMSLIPAMQRSYNCINPRRMIRCQTGSLPLSNRYGEIWNYIHYPKVTRRCKIFKNELVSRITRHLFGGTWLHEQHIRRKERAFQNLWHGLLNQRPSRSHENKRILCTLENTFLHTLFLHILNIYLSEAGNDNLQGAAR